jgi:hypothetical protein
MRGLRGRLAFCALLGFASACDGETVSLRQVCDKFCECSGLALPTQRARCVASCEAEVDGAQLPAEVRECFVGSSCAELSTGEECGL